MEPLEQTVLTNLVRYRKKAGLSQKQVEQQLKLRTHTLYDIEKNRQKLPFVLAVQLASLYHIDIGQLVDQQSTPPYTLSADKKVTPLESLGVVSGAFHPLTECIAQDPVIVAEIGVGEMGTQPIMDLLLTKLTDVQQQHFVVDLYRYINSAISSDGEIRQAELNLRDTLLAQAKIQLSESEQQSISRAFRKLYFGKTMSKSLPRDAYKHFLIWTLHLVSRIDGQPHFKTLDYIHQVAQHIQLPVSAVRYIEEKVTLAYRDER